MKHHHFKYIRNAIFIVIALSMAGYPYLIFSGYIFTDPTEYLARGLLILVILLTAFAGVAYAAHLEYKKRKQKEMSR